MISIVNDINAPPGILHPILTEKWAWVDDRLREIYYGEDHDELNEETFSEDILNGEIFEEVSLDDEEENGLFKENWGWVDERLRELYYGYGLNEETFDEYLVEGFLKENWAWVDERLSEKYDLKHVEDLPLPQCPLTWMDYRFGLEISHKTLEEMSYTHPIRREDPYNPDDCSKLFSLCDEDNLVDLESSLDLGSNVNSEELFSDYDFDSEEFYNDCVKVDNRYRCLY